MARFIRTRTQTQTIGKDERGRYVDVYTCDVETSEARERRPPSRYRLYERADGDTDFEPLEGITVETARVAAPGWGPFAARLADAQDFIRRTTP